MLHISFWSPSYSLFTRQHPLCQSHQWRQITNSQNHNSVPIPIWWRTHPAHRQHRCLRYPNQQPQSKLQIISHRHIRHQSLITNHQSLITNHQSPITNHSPFIHSTNLYFHPSTSINCEAEAPTFFAPTITFFLSPNGRDLNSSFVVNPNSLTR